MIPEAPGIYLFFLNGGMRLLKATAYFATESHTPLRVDRMLHLYTGAATNLRNRLEQHFDHDMRGSSLRRTLLSIEHAKRAVSLSRTPKCAVTDEKSLSSWLFRNSLVAIASTANPFEMERVVLEQYASPFNISLRKSNAYSRSLMAWRNSAFPPRYSVR